MGHPLRFAIDAAAAAILGAAVCFAVVSVLEVSLIVAGSIGALVFVRVFASLGRLPAEAPSMDRFEPAPLIFAGDHDELLLEQPVAAGSDGSRIVRLFGRAPQAGDSPGTDQAVPDATEQLRQALAQLRRAVR